MRNIISTAIIFFTLLSTSSVSGQIKKIWLTHRTNQPSHIVINWESDSPGASEVFFGLRSTDENHVVKKENVKLHHVEIPIDKKDTVYRYIVKTGEQKSAEQSFKSYPTTELRVVVVGNWGFAVNPDFTRLLQDDPHMLITCGDNIPDLHGSCGLDVKNCVEPYMKLVASAPKLFSSIPFMPVLGNHDKEIRPRRSRSQKEHVYDTMATAFREFVELPGDEWKWRFTVPELDATFIALDLNHMTDLGTTYQSCRDYRAVGEQFLWYRELMSRVSKGYTITLSNEKNPLMRTIEQGAWNEQMRKGSAVIAGFGHYLERSEVDGFPFFNTTLKAGDVYPDPMSQFTKGENGYILLTFRKDKPMIAQIKSLNGTILDESEWPLRN